MPGSRLEIFPKAGHFPHHSDPDRFVRLLDEFIATTEPGHHDQTGWRDLLLAGRVAPEPEDDGAAQALDRATVSSGS
jgi:hypothetical protein